MKLLVSVTSLEEAQAAVLGGADIIDVKNPLEGSLGAQVPHIIQAIAAAIPPPVELSASIGDVPNLPGTVALAGMGAALCGAGYVKVGLLGVRTVEAAKYLLVELRRAVKDTNPKARVVACAYADAAKINALDPLCLPEVAAFSELDGCMIDTAIKDGRTLFHCLTLSAIRSFIRSCHHHGLFCALAGSLGPGDLPWAESEGADIVGVRTAACEGGRRMGSIAVQKVRELKEALSLQDHRPLRPSLL